MRFISFDCAYLHMGVTVIQVNMPDLNDLPDISAVGRNPECIRVDMLLLYRYWQVLDRLYTNLLQLVYAGTWNLVDTDELDIHRAATVLHAKLSENDRQYGPFDGMMYENQMVQNDKSRTISHFLVYHYVSQCHVERVPPTLKNRLALLPTLAYGNFAARGGTRYSANKSHSVGTFNHWISVFPHPPLPGGKRDDIADSFTQFLGLLMLKSENRPAAKGTQVTRIVKTKPRTVKKTNQKKVHELEPPT